MVCVICGGYALFGIGVELWLGTWKPFAESYRLAGSVHPNKQGAFLALACLAAIWLVAQSTSARRRPAAAAALAFVLLLFTRSRSALAALLAVLLVTGFSRLTNRLRVASLLGGLLLLGAGLTTYGLLGEASRGRMVAFLLMGRGDNVVTLNGRIPIWAEIVPYVEERPLTGHGYGGFWTSDRIADVVDALGWPIHTAHSVYLESMLGVGAVGTVLLLATLVGAAIHGRREGLDGGTNGVLVPGIIVFGLTQGLLESGAALPGFESFLVWTAVAHVAVRFARTEEDEPTAKPLPPTSDGPPLISVVVATRNRAALLVGCLESLNGQTRDGCFDFEIVVVDNASSDDTPRVARRFARDSSVPVRYFRESRVGISAARNRGVREAAGQWIAFFDDDQVAHSDWLARLYGMAMRTGAPIVGGAVRLTLPPGQAGVLHPFCRMLFGEQESMTVPVRYSRRVTPGSGNLLLHESVFARAGGFDDSIERGEDTRLFLRMHKLGLEGWYTPDAVVHHVIEAELLSPRSLTRRAGDLGFRMAARDRSLFPVSFVLTWIQRLARLVLLRWPGLILARRSQDPMRLLGERCKIALHRGYLRRAWKGRAK
jgi:glycosyltransferase involved in cell wall biosynthesis